MVLRRNLSEQWRRNRHARNTDGGTSHRVAPGELVVAMVERFLAGDRAFGKANAGARIHSLKEA
jgi:hypothetical protein